MISCCIDEASLLLLIVCKYLLVDKNCCIRYVMGAGCWVLDGSWIVECRNSKQANKLASRRGVKKTCFRLVFVGIFRPESNRRLLHYHNFKLPMTKMTQKANTMHMMISLLSPRTWFQSVQELTIGRSN
jgi:hypothetical protein